MCALGRLAGGPRDELRGILSAGTGEPSQLARAVSLMEQAGAIDHVREVARDLADSAKRRLDGVGLSPEALEVLVAMADFFVERAG